MNTRGSPNGWACFGLKDHVDALLRFRVFFDWTCVCQERDEEVLRAVGLVTCNIKAFDRRLSSCFGFTIRTKRNLGIVSFMTENPHFVPRGSPEDCMVSVLWCFTARRAGTANLVHAACIHCALGIVWPFCAAVGGHCRQEEGPTGSQAPNAHVAAVLCLCCR
jgi:hypothetical protein